MRQPGDNGRMGLSIGIVGLPNVGKSTLFNALTNNDVLAANYPFATIDPNVGIVNVPDPRLDVLTRMFASVKTVPATVTFVDIAPATSPAMSTKVTVAGLMGALPYISDSLCKRSSGTGTMPVFGSIVAKG